MEPIHSTTPSVKLPRSHPRYPQPKKKTPNPGKTKKKLLRVLRSTAQAPLVALKSKNPLPVSKSLTHPLLYRANKKQRQSFLSQNRKWCGYQGSCTHTQKHEQGATAYILLGIPFPSSIYTKTFRDPHLSPSAMPGILSPTFHILGSIFPLPSACTVVLHFSSLGAMLGILFPIPHLLGSIFPVPPACTVVFHFPSLGAMLGILFPIPHLLGSIFPIPPACTVVFHFSLSSFILHSSVLVLTLAPFSIGGNQKTHSHPTQVYRGKKTKKTCIRAEFVASNPDP